MKKIVINVDKTVTESPRIVETAGVWRSERTPDCYDLWGGDEPNVLLNKIYYWPYPAGKSLPLWPYYFIENRRCDRQWYRHFNMGCLAVTLILEGQIEYAEDHKCTTVGPGEVMLQIPGYSGRMINADDSPSHKLVLLFTGWGRTLFPAAAGYDTSSLIVLNNSSVIEKKMRNIGKLIKQKRESDTLLLAEKGYELWLELLEQKTKSVLPESLERICRFIERKNFMVDDVQQLARENGVSHSTLLRLFREYFNTTPHAYLLEKRLLYSTVWLRAGYNVKETARQCGFA
ncbi:MAG: helix-turn-helix transcriptional regulator, partial [Lentisphaeria bacterium]|nr:helix-turn-helix transcriptional regulator [Lentisphaeria bacterium]